MNNKYLMLLCMMSLPVVGFAGLGGSVDPLPRNTPSALISAQRAADVVRSYTVHDLRDEAGNQIKEYSNAQGIVFAVTWQGPFKPDMRQLFGTYFGEYTASVGAAGKTNIASRVVVVSEGRLLNFHGKAYLPEFLPADMALKDIQ